MVRALEENPECVMAFSNYEIIDKAGAVLAITRKIQHYHGNHPLAPGYHGSFERIVTIFRAVTVISGSLLRRDATDWTDVPAGLSNAIDTYIGFPKRRPVLLRRRAIGPNSLPLGDSDIGSKHRFEGAHAEARNLRCALGARSP